MPAEYKVEQIRNRSFTSNCYLITNDTLRRACLIDIGDFECVAAKLSYNFEISDLFLTHYHYDHIWGINELVDKYPNCRIITNEHGLEGLRSAKINLSFYHESPVYYNRGNVSLVDHNSEVSIFNNCSVKVHYTPGHNPSCLTYKLDSYIFTGDAYIPGIKVVTKLKGGDNRIISDSLQIIRNLVSEESYICPGHGDIIRGENALNDPVLVQKTGIKNLLKA
ncbi:MAG: MBL fold metallo-hydrolase [Ignavibacteriales bacterium]|nr:MAG: MBL fold metallo-hydrolase [Ignavibacteriales bacterium]